MLSLMLRILPALFFLYAGLAQATDHYSRIYIFGDSLSDTGNLASVIGPFPPPFYMNRVSNGPVAVGVLADSLGLDAQASLHLIGPASGSNYAVAGARAHGDDPIDLDTQILMFQANHGYQAPADALYVMFIGGNDLRDARDATDPASSRDAVKRAVMAVKQAFTSLTDMGARHFLVINAPNIAQIPETRLLATALEDPELIRRADRVSRMYRRMLHKTTQRLEHDHPIRIDEFDLLRFFNRLVKNARHYGFTNSTDACFSSVSYTFHPDCNNGMNFDEFIFFDEIHPTARVHGIVGRAFYQALQKTPKPPYRHEVGVH